MLYHLGIRESTLHLIFSQAQLTLLKRVAVHKYSVKFYRAHLHHFLSALAFIAELLIYLKWKKKSHRKEKQAFVGVWQCFPYMLSPWVRVHPVYRHILQTCTNLRGKAVGVHSPVTWKTPRKTREKTMHPRNYHIGHTFPAIFSQDISMLLILLHTMKTAGHFGGALMSLQRLQL